MSKKLLKVKAIIAPREPVPCAMVPGRGLMLLDPPKNPGFKAWIEGKTTTWDHGNTREEAEEQIRKLAPTHGFEITEIIQQEKAVMY